MTATLMETGSYGVHSLWTIDLSSVEVTEQKGETGIAY